MGSWGVSLIIIYYIYNNLIYVGEVTHFLCSKCSKCSKGTIVKISWLKLRQNRQNDFRLLRKWHFVCNKFANYANADWRTGQAKPQQSTLRRPALPNAYHAYLCQNSRRIRHLRRPSKKNHTLSVIIGRTCPTNGQKM